MGSGGEVNCRLGNGTELPLFNLAAALSVCTHSRTADKVTLPQKHSSLSISLFFLNHSNIFISLSSYLFLPPPPLQTSNCLFSSGLFTPLLTFSRCHSVLFLPLFSSVHSFFSHSLSLPLQSSPSLHLSTTHKSVVFFYILTLPLSTRETHWVQL